MIFSVALLTTTGGRFYSETRTCLPQVRVYVSTLTMTSPSTDCWRAPTISNPGQIKAKCAKCALQEWSSHATVNRESLKNAYDPMSQYPQLCKHFKSHFSGDIESWPGEFLMCSIFNPILHNRQWFNHAVIVSKKLATVSITMLLLNKSISSQF